MDNILVMRLDVQVDGGGGDGEGEDKGGEGGEIQESCEEELHNDGILVRCVRRIGGLNRRVCGGTGVVENIQLPKRKPQLAEPQLSLKPYPQIARFDSKYRCWWTFNLSVPLLSLSLFSTSFTISRCLIP